LVCVSNSTAVLGGKVCNPAMRAITAGIKAVATGLVNFAEAVGRTSADIWNTAVQGVYRFFSILFPGTPKDQYPAFNYWRGNNIMDDSTYFFIRVYTYELTDKSVGFGVVRKMKGIYPIGYYYEGLSNSMPVTAGYYRSGSDYLKEQFTGFWWYVSNIMHAISVI